MARTTIVILCLTALSVYAIPVNNEHLDKDNRKAYIIDKETTKSLRQSNQYLHEATVNDVSANSVTEEKKATDSLEVQEDKGSTVQISGITTGASPPPPQADSLPSESTPFRPQRAGSMFARFIDDIFQIPITVLQNVARLISNPFTQRKPEVIATVSP